MVLPLRQMTLKRKLLRNQHRPRREYKKMKLSKKSGAGAEEVYTPKSINSTVLKYYYIINTVQSRSTVSLHPPCFVIFMYTSTSLFLNIVFKVNCKTEDLKIKCRLIAKFPRNILKL